MARFTVACIFTAALLVQSLTATTHYVGPCKKGSFQTISAAINDTNTITGDIIDVCPGTYPEQVIISKSLTLQAITSNNSSSVLVPGNAGTTTSSVLATVLEPSVWVTATDGPVKINNILSEGHCFQSGVTGVAFYFASGTSGTLNHIRAEGCGAGVWVENSSGNIEGVTIENSVIGGVCIDVKNCGGTVALTYGIVAASQQPQNTIPVLSATITGNQIQDVVYGIYLVGGAGSVSGNSIAHNGILNDQAYGVYDLAPATTVSNNTVIAASGVFTGVVIGAANASIKNNKITSGIGVNFNCLAATVSGNTINASLGLYKVPNILVGTNSFFNTGTIRSGGC